MAQPTVDPRGLDQDGYKLINEWYIKDTGDGRMYMSGLPIPRDYDGITRNYNFVNCDFHPASHGKFENCRIDGRPIPDGEGCLYDYDNAIRRGEPLL